jgi:SAM-dependent methyltransferase
MTADPRRRLVEATAAPYRAAGLYAWHFARGKLGGDPVFCAILRDGLIPASADVLDLGCGQGLLAGWLSAASRAYADGEWPAGWAAPPRLVGYRGIELTAKDVARARTGLPAQARAEQGDIRQVAFGRVNTVVILDVLHYVEPVAQRAVLARVRACLEPGGVLLLRVGDAAAGLRFRASQGVDWLVTRLRGQASGRLHCRALADWHADLEALDFTVRMLPMSTGTPFANHLLIASTGDGNGAH